VVHLGIFCCQLDLAYDCYLGPGEVMLEQMRKNIISQVIESIKILPLFIVTIYIMKVAVDEVGELLYWLLGM
jgi:hypothetical protein